jgi:hypothetical protein
MTVTLSPDQPAEGAAVDDESDIIEESPHNKTQVQESAMLLAQAYVGMPLFP